jgi:hypothetical protein
MLNRLTWIIAGDGSGDMVSKRRALLIWLVTSLVGWFVVLLVVLFLLR